MQDCHNFTLNANTKVLTSTVEIFKGSECTLNINTDCGTFQADQVQGLKVRQLRHDFSHFYFYSISQLNTIPTRAV